MRLSNLLAPVFALILVSCGGGGGSTPGNTSIPGPTNLRATLGTSPNNFVLSWTPPAGAISGYNLEAQSGSEPFTNMFSGLIPSDYTSLSFFFNNTAPEQTDFNFRINAAIGSTVSGYSNTATFRHGLNTPGTPSGQFDWSQAGVSISWSRETKVGDGLMIERNVTDQWGSTNGSWTALSVPDPLASSFLDTTTKANTYYSYRITNKLGSSSSQASPISQPIFTGLAAPSQPTVTFDFTTLGMNISWVKNTTFNDNVKIERIETTNYGSQIGTWVELTPTDPTGNTFLDTTVTLNSYYSYRITNLRGGTASNASFVSYCALAGIQGPSWAYANWDSNLGGITVSWYVSSTTGSVLLERALSDNSGTTIGNWSTLATLPITATNYTDLTTQELTYYLYRVSLVRGAMTSRPTLTYQTLTPMAPPTGLTAAATPEGAKLEWQNHSTSAAQLVVRRAPAGSYSGNATDMAILTTTTTSYTDPITSLGYFDYRICAKNGYNEASSKEVAFTTPNPLDALKLANATRSFPDAADAALLQDGSWALATTSPFGVLSNSNPWSPNFPNNNYRSATNMLQTDAQGHPHLVYLTLNLQNSQQAILRHLWFDGTAWQSEDMGHIEISYYGGSYTYTLDSTGKPQALLDPSYYNTTTNSLLYVHKVGSSWTQEPLSGLNLTENFSNYRLRMDGADSPHVLLASWNSLYECTRDVQGNWQAGLLPTGSIQFNSSDFVDGIWADADNGTLFYSIQGSYPTYNTQLFSMKKVTGVWQAPTVVTNSGYGISGIQIAYSSDRARIALLFNTSAGLKTFHLDENGWHQTLIFNLIGTYSPLYRIGFDTSKKIHILVKNPSPAVGYTEFMEQ